MIKKLIGKLLGKRDEAPGSPPPAPPVIPLGRRVEVPAAEHGIDPRLVDERALKVVRTLQDAGHEAYIVGGAVRDLLLGLRPKDFDVATDATPEQVKALFRRAFIIGRRFRIVHVIFGRGRDHEVIEVSTFRAYLDPSSAEAVDGNEKTSKAALADKRHAVDASGRVLRDNVWGPQIEDAARRDFTINAMYYDPTRQVVVDYHGGLADLRARVLRMIGEPMQRYREDPVRVVRVVRFAAKLGFEVEERTRAPIPQVVPLLAAVPASRLFDEMFKLLQTGHALRSVEALRRFGLVPGVFPILDAALLDTAHERRQAFIRLALEDTDRRVAEGRAVAPSFLLACLLWHDVQARWAQRRAEGEHPVPALQQAIDAVFDARIGDVSGRGKLAADMREIWLMQPRFERRIGNTPASLVEQPRFRAGYDFLRLRADVGEVDAELAEWWEDYALGTPEEREALVAAVREAHRRVVRQRPATATGTAGAPAAEAAGEPAAGGDTAAPAAKRRRRRRRKPGGGGAPSEPAAGDASA
ncbi:polynucleotide adenylyltransferase PcnB [Calidifontimicrobium sp. SYSU G02091]|uniref:polynucleotide adenylyltransferase PcnB n=1 Tax=Calidifontimicrobium sp. SYSU G02091 TaxID=2926421 RepID=UPI001F5353DF|nr:polynucleotide adenylyltransferase PcnB [Calidifontimicrobium sp. SYSU G02091]MCI1192300.1 polynucleotide adenylyltransferase PcnB [Calidifontimicrobium sp. SYSU G02091]